MKKTWGMFVFLSGIDALHNLTLVTDSFPFQSRMACRGVKCYVNLLLFYRFHPSKMIKSFSNCKYFNSPKKGSGDKIPGVKC